LTGDQGRIVQSNELTTLIEDQLAELESHAASMPPIIAQRMSMKSAPTG
jgi:hypothetical protein